MSNEIFFVGSNLATLVGGCELAKKGYRVRIFTDGAPLGGYFSGISLDGRDFDFGMFLFEQFSNIQSGRERSTINSWLENSAEISNWLNENVKLKRAITAEVYIFGKKYPDYIMSNKLDILLSTDVAPPNRLDVGSPYHASNKEHSRHYDSMSYLEACKHNHGDDFHFRYIEPFIKKIIGHGSENFLARYHRFSWAPLYYPETLADVIENNKISIPEYPFWTTNRGFAGDLVRNLKKIIDRFDNVEIIEDKISDLKIGESTLVVNKKKYKTEGKVHLGLSMGRVSTLLGFDDQLKGEGVDFTIAIALVHRDSIKAECGCIFIVDDKFGSYRFTDQDSIAGLDPEWHRVVIESNSKILQLKYPGKDKNRAIVQDLKFFLDISEKERLKVLKILNIQNGLYLPTLDFINSKKRASDKILHITKESVSLTGDLAGYGTSSINNQIAQGLQLSKSYERHTKD